MLPRVNRGSTWCHGAFLNDFQNWKLDDYHWVCDIWSKLREKVDKSAGGGKGNVTALSIHIWIAGNRQSGYSIWPGVVTLDCICTFSLFPAVYLVSDFKIDFFFYDAVFDVSFEDPHFATEPSIRAMHMLTSLCGSLPAPPPPPPLRLQLHRLTFFSRDLAQVLINIPAASLAILSQLNHASCTTDVSSSSVRWILICPECVLTGGVWEKWARQLWYCFWKCFIAGDESVWDQPRSQVPLCRRSMASLLISCTVGAFISWFKQYFLLWLSIVTAACTEYCAFHQPNLQRSFKRPTANAGGISWSRWCFSVL